MDVTQAYLAFHEEKIGAREAADRSARRGAPRAVYAVQSLELAPGDVARAGRRRSRSRGEVYSPDGRAPVGAGRHRARRRHAGVRRRHRHGWRDAAQACARPLRVLADAHRPAAAARQVLRARARDGPGRRAPVRSRRAARSWSPAIRARWASCGSRIDGTTMRERIEVVVAGRDRAVRPPRRRRARRRTP